VKSFRTVGIAAYVHHTQRSLTYAQECFILGLVDRGVFRACRRRAGNGREAFVINDLNACPFYPPASEQTEASAVLDFDYEVCNITFETQDARILATPKELCVCSIVFVPAPSGPLPARVGQDGTGQG